MRAADVQKANPKSAAPLLEMQLSLNPSGGGQTELKPSGARDITPCSAATGKELLFY